MSRLFLKHWRSLLIGHPEETPLRQRIFHAANLFTCLMLTVVFLFNLTQAMFDTAGVVAFIGLFHGGLYYLSRVRRQFSLARAGFVLICYGGAVANYFVNDGINGPTLFVFFFTFQLLITVNRTRFHLFFILVTCGVVFTLLFLEYSHPTWVNSDYSGRLPRITNVLVIFVILLLSFYWVARMLLDNYYEQKKRATRHAEEVEAQHRKLQQLTKEKDKLFSIVFHDLKSPLSSVQLYLQAIASYDLKEEADKRIKSNLLQLTKDTSVMLENVLNWIADQQEDKDATLEQIDCAEILNLCLRIEQPFAESKEVSIICSLADDNEVMGDAVMTQMILRVLINNAIKFSHPHQQVVVHVRRTTENYSVSVTDEGTGIPLTVQDQLFSSGVVSTRGTHNEKGSGLGLLLAKQYAEKQGCKLYFISVPDKGSTFTLAFPLGPSSVLNDQSSVW